MLDSSAVIARFDDVAMMCDTIEQCGCHFLVSKDRRPFTKGKIGGNDHRGPLIEVR